MTRYCCQFPQRIEAVRNHATLNGLEYLEVIDRDAPSEALRQRTLLIRCVKPLAVAPPRNVWKISGGVRVHPIAVMWVEMASEAAALFASGRITASERDALMDQKDPSALIVLRTDKTGDFSGYTLSLGEIDTPFAGFDARSSSIEFSFKVECPSPFDCAPDINCDEAPIAPPPIDYLVKDYSSFRQMMLNRLAVTLPQWTTRSPADMGTVLVEVLAEEADQLSQYQDAVATEAYLSTARRRTSLRRHARMLDYRMHEGANARAFVTLVAAPAVQNLALAPLLSTGERVQILTRMGKMSPVLDPSMAADFIEQKQPLVFEPMHSLRIFEAHNALKFHTWGDHDCMLQKGAVAATLIDASANRLRLMPGDFLVFEEHYSPNTGLSEDANPKQRHVVRLTEVTPSATQSDDGSRSAGPLAMDDLLAVPIVEIKWDIQDALPFCLIISATVSIDGIATKIPDISLARGNILLCDHGRSIPEIEILENRAGITPYRPILEQINVTRSGIMDTLDIKGRLRRASAFALAQHDANSSSPAIHLVDRSNLEWIPKADLLDSDRFDAHFVVEREDNGIETLRFGDGLYGMDPSTTSQGLTTRFEASYRIGNGGMGNCGAEALAHLVFTPGAGIIAIRNPLAASGGIEPQSREAVRIAAPQAFRTQLRAVTPEDYVARAEQYPEVQKAAALRRWTGSWHTLFLSVDRKGGLPVDDVFESDLITYLESYRLACHDLEIEPPEMVALDIAVNVCVYEDAEASDVEARLLQTFSTGWQKNDQMGFFHPDLWTFGTPLYLSDLIAKAQAVDGVSHVSIDRSLPKPGRFHPWAEVQRDEIDRGIIDPGSRRILRCENDPNAPENGRIQFFMMGGI